MKLEVSTFRMYCTDKEQVLKVLEESAEVFGAWQHVYDCMEVNAYTSSSDFDFATRLAVMDMADELADVITAACNLAGRYGIDLQAALYRCEQRNRERGRYGEGS